MFKRKKLSSVTGKTFNANMASTQDEESFRFNASGKNLSSRKFLHSSFTRKKSPGAGLSRNAPGHATDTNSPTNLDL